MNPVMPSSPAEAELPPLFSDGKADDAFRTIGEVAKALGIRPHVLRYWEEQMPMLRPVKRGGGRRYYRLEDIRLVQTIDRLIHHEGYTLRGARQAIEAGLTGAVDGDASPQLAAAPMTSAVTAPPMPPSDIVTRLQAIRNQLAAALQL